MKHTERQSLAPAQAACLYRRFAIYMPPLRVWSDLRDSRATVGQTRDQRCFGVAGETGL